MRASMARAAYRGPRAASNSMASSRRARAASRPAHPLPGRTLAGQPWTATAFSLSQLREFGLDPSSDRARRAVAAIGASSRWDHDGEPYWQGSSRSASALLVTRPTPPTGAYSGVEVSPVVDRLVGERLADGGWNCERADGSVRSCLPPPSTSSRSCSRTSGPPGGTSGSREARRCGEEGLLERHLFRPLSTGTRPTRGPCSWFTRRGGRALGCSERPPS